MLKQGLLQFILRGHHFAAFTIKRLTILFYRALRSIVIASNGPDYRFRGIIQRIHLWPISVVNILAKLLSWNIRNVICSSIIYNTLFRMIVIRIVILFIARMIWLFWLLLVSSMKIMRIIIWFVLWLGGMLLYGLKLMNICMMGWLWWSCLNYINGALFSRCDRCGWLLECYLLIIIWELNWFFDNNLVIWRLNEGIFLNYAVFADRILVAVYANPVAIDVCKTIRSWRWSALLILTIQYISIRLNTSSFNALSIIIKNLIMPLIFINLLIFTRRYRLLIINELIIVLGRIDLVIIVCPVIIVS